MEVVKNMLRDEIIANMHKESLKSVSELIDDPFEVRVVCTLQGEVESILLTLAF